MPTNLTVTKTAAATNLNLDELLKDTSRIHADTVGVDSGTMTIAVGDFAFDDMDDFRFEDGGHTVNGRDVLAVTGSGFGDGGYPVLTVQRDGTFAGVEVVFILSQADTAADEAATAAGLIEPDEETRETAFRGADEAAKAAANDIVNTYHREHGALFQEAFDRLTLTVDPRENCTPALIAVFDVTDGVLQVGDPCYGYASYDAKVPNGSYAIVAFSEDHGTWGTRIARLGGYLLP